MTIRWIATRGLLWSWIVFCWAGAAPAQTVAPPSSLAPAPAAVEVDRFLVTGNTLLAPELLQSTLEPFRGRRSLDELRSAAQAVQRLYSRAGYGGVVAFLPAQTITGGQARIEVVEGKVKSILVHDAPGFDKANVLASVPDLVIGQTPRALRINAQSELANENPAKHLQVLLEPGDSQGEIAARLAVQARPLQTMTLGLDDTGTERTGRYRIGATWQDANLSGRDDVVSAQYQTSPSSPNRVTVLSAGYHLPLYAQLATLDAYIAYADVNAGSSATAAGDVSISGRGHQAGLKTTWLLPLASALDQRIGLALDVRAYINNCEVAGLPSGACGPAGADVTVTPLTVDYAIHASDPVLWGGDLALIGNLGGGGGNGSQASFDAVRTGARRDYSMLRLSLSGAASIAGRWQLRWRLAGQASGDGLVPGEQFGLGGASTVRGYDERELVGDSGYAASVEFAGPELLASAGSGMPSLQVFGFVDGGSVENHLGAPCLGTATRCSLSSVGPGAQFIDGALQARVAMAHALSNGATTRRGNNRVHVALSYSF